MLSSLGVFNIYLEMQKLITLVLLTIFTLSYCSQEKYNSLFWKIYGNNLNDTSFLYGTMHTQDERVFQFRKGVNDAFNKSTIYAMELNIDSIDQVELMQGLIMDSSTTL